MRRRESGFVLLDAMAAMVIGAGVLVGIYAMISSAARGSASARDTAYAATAAASFCAEVTATDVAAGNLARTQDGLQLAAQISQEARPNLPARTQLWRIDCAAQKNGVLLATQRSYALKAVPQDRDDQPQQPGARPVPTPPLQAPQIPALK